MTGTPILLLPLLVVLLGAFAASFCGSRRLRSRVGFPTLSWFLTALMLVSFLVLLLGITPAALQEPLGLRITWIPSTGLNLGLYFDAFTALFALLVTGIGTLIVLYSRYYFQEDNSNRPDWGEWRFYAYLFLFTFAMLGLVMAGDLITLFIFWEGTSIASFLLIAYKYKDPAARRGAFKSLLITGGGGIALLLGFLLIGTTAGGYSIPTVLTSGELLRTSSLYPLMLLLIAIGATTKSAQFPAHVWLPDAMSAPTPASAFLHSATMVKAGIYLIARLNPALGQTEEWFWVFSTIGLITMLTGAYLGLKQNDLKALLAYSTISQLGVLVLLIGQDTDIAFKALVIGVIAHALYKSALFLIAGNVDHEAGTRDLRRLGGIGRWMPFSMAIAALAGLSMAGLPPMFGFLAKETLLATAVHPSLPTNVSGIFPAATVVAGALILAQAVMFVWDTFLGKQRDDSIHPHEAPWGMLLAPLVPAFFSILLGLLPEPEQLATFLARAAGIAYGGEVKVSLALWAGLTVPLLLSAVAVASGLLIFAFRKQIRQVQSQVNERYSLNTVYAWLLGLIDHAAYRIIQLQNGSLRTYLSVIIGGMILTTFLFVVLIGVGIQINFSPLSFDFRGEIALLRIFTLFMVVGASLATIFLRRDLSAIIALGASGLAVAVIMVLEPAPDVALVQIVVDILAVVILTLALSKIPRAQRQAAQISNFLDRGSGVGRDGMIAVFSGLIVSSVNLVALVTRPRFSAATDFFTANAKALTGAKDIVGAIVVDFRAYDTFIEIVVFSLAGLGISAILRKAAHAPHGVSQEHRGKFQPFLEQIQTTGISGTQTSSFIHALAYLSLPLSLVIGSVHVLYGHDQPGDGFTAGVIVSLAIGFWYVIFGYEGVRSRLTWLKPVLLIGWGILLALVTGLGSLLIAGAFFGHVDYGALLGIRLPTGVNLSSALMFEISILLAVLGSASLILDGLGHPGEDHAEADHITDGGLA